MLIVSGAIEVAEADVAAAKDAALEMMEATVREPGCLAYEFSQVLGRATRFRIYEEWESETALDAHFRMPHMARFRDALSGLTIISREIWKISDGVRAPL